MSSGLPPSPTLTNPDMILPYTSPSNDYSQSTPGRPQQLPSPPSYGERPTRSSSLRDSRVRMRTQGQNLSPFRHGVLSRLDDPTRATSNSERENEKIKYEHALLSYRPNLDVPIASSPTLEDEHGRDAKSSKIKLSEDEVSTASADYNSPAILEEDENDPYSHAAMTVRAEEILANAKKRLLNMEGNLSRARSTLNSRPSSSMSSFVDRGREPVSLYTIPNRKLGDFTPPKHRQPVSSLDDSKQWHSKSLSETAVPSSMHTTGPNAEATKPQNLETDADANSSDRHSEPSRNWFWNGLTRNTSLSHTGRHKNALQPLHEDEPAPASFDNRAFREDEDEAESQDQDFQFGQSSQLTTTLHNENHTATGLTRAHSTTQTRDLREQMSELKGKISTLKQKAREDNLRRRSLQNLRTPNPFTAAEQWGSGQSTHDKDETPDTPGLSEKILTSHTEHLSDEILQVERIDHALNFAVEKSVPVEGALNNVRQNGHFHLQATDRELSDTESPAIHEIPSQLLAKSHEPFNQEASNEEEENVRVSHEVLSNANGPEGKEDSLYGDQDYHETFSVPLGERHEDRPDAFDYEHFYLHSAMGSYAKTGLSRRSSGSSIYSVETTKPANVDAERTNGTTDDHVVNGGHGRQNSVDSVSSLATFATATEGNEAAESNFEKALVIDSSQSNHSGKQKVDGSHAETPPKGPRGSKRSDSGRKEEMPADSLTGEIRTLKGNVLSSLDLPGLLSYLSRLLSRDESLQEKKVALGGRDTDLVERLVHSLAQVCSQLHTLESEGGKYEARVCRRKLDAARRVLDDVPEGEAF